MKNNVICFKKATLNSKANRNLKAVRDLKAKQELDKEVEALRVFADKAEDWLFDVFDRNEPGGTVGDEIYLIWVLKESSWNLIDKISRDLKAETFSTFSDEIYDHTLAMKELFKMWNIKIEE
jgi:hypothetical protein